MAQNFISCLREGQGHRILVKSYLCKVVPGASLTWFFDSQVVPCFGSWQPSRTRRLPSRTLVNFNYLLCQLVPMLTRTLPSFHFF